MSPVVASLPTPAEPFAGWPVHMMIGHDDGFIWYAGGGIICVQLRVQRLDVATTTRYINAIRSVRASMADDIARAGGVRLYQDGRTLRVIDRDARVLMTRASKRDFAPGSLVFNKTALPIDNRFVRAAVQLLALTVRQLGLPSFDLTSDLATALSQANVRPLEEGPTLDALRSDYARRVSGEAAA